MFTVRQEVLSKEKFVKMMMALKSQTREVMVEDEELNLYEVFMEYAEMDDLEVDITEDETKLTIEEDIEESNISFEELSGVEVISSEKLLEEIDSILTNEEKSLIYNDLDMYVIDITYLDELEYYNDIKLTTKKLEVSKIYR